MKRNKMMNFVINTIYIPLTVLALMACGEIKKDKAEEPQPPSVIEKPIPPKKEESIKSTDVKFVLQETNLPHQYQLFMSWPDSVKKVVVEDNGHKVFETDSVHQILHPLRDDTKFNVRVFTYDGEKPVLIGDLAGTVPKDFSFDGPLELTEDLNIEANRVFFTNHANIRTNGFRLKITATKIFADDAEIFSFPIGSKAPLRVSGRNGGQVFIKSKEAFGHLKIQLNGEHGGDGIDGEPYAGRASDGLPGKNGDHECLRAPVTGTIIKCACTSQPDPGTPGAAGAQGRPGIAAGAGGNSGSILIEISEKTEFVVEPFQSSGLAGRPGKGGPGQPGGIGGPPGDPTSRECHESNPGANGATGAPGDDAAPKSDGINEYQCISMGQGEGKCKI